jgi:hypothetical protein
MASSPPALSSSGGEGKTTKLFKLGSLSSMAMMWLSGGVLPVSP